MLCVPLNISFFLNFFFPLLKFFSNFGEEQAVLPTRSCSPDSQACTSYTCSPAPFVFFSMNFQRPWIHLELGHSKCQVQLFCRLFEFAWKWHLMRWLVGWLVVFWGFFWLAILVVLNIWHSRWLDIFNSSLLHTGLKISSWTWLREQHALFYLV